MCGPKCRGQRGKFVGIVQTMAGSAGLGFLEGDEQFRVDSQVWGKSQVPPTVIGPWNGTGTEDCFNSGWYFSSGPNALPVNGALIRDRLDGMGRINCVSAGLSMTRRFSSSPWTARLNMAEPMTLPITITPPWPTGMPTVRLSPGR